MERVVHRDQVLHLVDSLELPEIHRGDLTWYRASGIKSIPEWSDPRLGLHAKSTCCGYLRLVYSWFMNTEPGQTRKEAHTGFCADCGKELQKMIPHQIDKNSVGEFIMPFGKHKGTKLAQIPEDYLHWATSTLDNSNIKKRIELYLASR